VLGNKAILEIARIKPVTKTGLNGIQGLSPKLIDYMGKSLVAKVKEGLCLPDEALPVYPKKARQRLKSKDASRVKALKSWRERLTGEWGVDPAVVCTNAQIQAIAIANPGEPEDMECIEDIKKWQIKLFGLDICNVLRETD
jgi:ribonuclease D